MSTGFDDELLFDELNDILDIDMTDFGFDIDKIDLFKENERHFLSSTRLGNCLQYIGKHTLDIYFIHYFFLPYNMSFVGQWLLKYPNPILEFFISVTLASIVISVCLIVSRIIRISPLLTYLLLGGKSLSRRQENGLT